jgi:hypothetical protein
MLNLADIKYTPDTPITLQNRECIDAEDVNLYVGCGSTGQICMRQKVVVLRELQQAIIYTTR